MRGPSRALPKYRKHRPSGQAVVTLNGKDIYLGPHGIKTSHVEYDRLIQEWLAHGRRLPSAVEEQSISIVELCSEYWKFAQSYYVKHGKPTDEIASLRIALRFLREDYGRIAAVEFGPLALESVRNRMIETGNSRGYINGNVNRIRRMFRWAVQRELVPPATYQALVSLPGLREGKTLARETDPIQPVSFEIISETIKHATPIIADMIQLQYLLGCRPGELCSMKAGEIDCDSVVWRYQPSTHKMEHKGRNRTILIGPDAQRILAPYLNKADNEFCFEKPRGGKFRRWNYHEKILQACNRAFPAPHGTSGEALKAWRKKHGWAPNRLRHARATEIREKYGLEAAQAVLGHAKADVTQIYAERDIGKAAKIMSEIG